MATKKATKKDILAEYSEAAIALEVAQGAIEKLKPKVLAHVLKEEAAGRKVVTDTHTFITGRRTEYEYSDAVLTLEAQLKSKKEAEKNSGVAKPHVGSPYLTVKSR